MYRDKRGIIKDLVVGKRWALTYITFNKGAVRGNHFHKKTWQFDFIWGRFLIATDKFFCKSFGLVIHPPLSPHAYKALKKSRMLTFVVGERIGDKYDSDTYKVSLI